MIKSGSDIEAIIEKFAVLENEIAKNAKAGLTNIHKHAENLFRDVLSLTYQQDLQNMNKPGANFPGIDLGSERDGIAYQISSRSDNDKINNTIEIFLRNGLHSKFKKLRFLILSQKKSSYKVAAHDPSFVFNPKEDILDLNDLTNAISALPTIQIRMIRQLVDAELEYEMKNNGADAEQDNFLIQVDDDMESCKLDTYSHWSVDLMVKGINFPVPLLYRSLTTFFNNIPKRTSLPIFFDTFQKRGR